MGRLGLLFEAPVPWPRYAAAPIPCRLVGCHDVGRVLVQAVALLLALPFSVHCPIQPAQEKSGCKQLTDRLQHTSLPIAETIVLRQLLVPNHFETACRHSFQ